MDIKTINPSTEEIIEAYPFMVNETVNVILNEAQEAFKTWKKTPFDKRAILIQNVADLLNTNAEKYAKLLSQEMGKPVKEGIAEVKKCALCCSYYIEHGQRFLADEIIQTEKTKSYTTLQPLGTILAIMPWNYPYWQLIRHAIPALISGNVVLLKHAPNVTGTALLIEEIFRQAGFPKGVFSTLIVDIETTAEIIADPRVKAITLTGSTRAGKAVAAKAGSVIKKVVLELGGSDPYLILEDAPMDIAVKACSVGRLQNAGQSCIAAKRMIVHQSIATEFEQKLLQNMGKAKLGDPFDEITDLGPMARADLRTQLHQQVQKSIHLGAKCILGGYIPEGKGYFYPPTILTNVKKGMPAFDEELFGPVAAIIIANDEQDAIDKANDSIYGLGAAVFSKNIKKAEHIARNELNVGICTVNNFNQSDPRLPFGGINQSGYGRELSANGIREFMNLKTVVLN